VVYGCFAGIVDETVSESRDAADTTDRDNLAGRLAASFSALVAFEEQFKESHGSGEDGGDICFKSLGPEFLRAVVEVVVTNFCGGRFGRRFRTGVWRRVESGLAGVIDEEVDVACFLGDFVDGALEVGVRGCAALDGDQVSVFLLIVSERLD
jgi:hypothetical protein